MRCDDNIVRINDPGTPTVIRLEVPGLPGPSGSGSAQSFTQAVPAASWGFAHNLARRPGVTVYATSGELVLADVWADAETVSITHAQAMTGFVVLT